MPNILLCSCGVKQTLSSDLFLGLGDKRMVTMLGMDESFGYIIHYFSRLKCHLTFCIIIV